MSQKSARHEHWSSRLGFLMAAIGSAVGLGNFWKFPYEAGENGGGAFVLVYLLCILFVGLPVLMAELVIGRHGKMSGPSSFGALARARGYTGAWSIAGWLAVLSGVLVLSYYSVIAGWVVFYIFEAASGDLNGKSAEDVAGIFENLLASPMKLMIVHGIFMAITTFIVARGIRKGIETASAIMMPVFILLLAAMVVYSLSTADAGAAAQFLFSVDFSKITFKVAIEAIGHAFFSLGVGGALMITYGAYLDDNVDIPQSGTIIAAADTSVSILAGLAIFPIVFAFGLSPNSGPGLLFVTLPTAFAGMDYGAVVGTAFFVLGFVAALTSSISILEVMVSRLEEMPGVSRPAAAVGVGLLCFILGILTVLSSDPETLKEFYPLGFIPMFAHMTFFDVFDFLVSNLLLPVGGILAAVFAGWIMSRDETRAELGMSDGLLFRVWRFLVRWLSPIAVGLVLLGLFGVFEMLGFGNGG